MNPELKRLLKKKHKHRAKPVTIDGIYFPSTLEGKRYLQLKMMKQIGVIKDFELQPTFKMIIHRKYRADFKVIYPDGSIIYEDTKGQETKTFKENHKAFKKHYPDLELRIIKKL